MCCWESALKFEKTQAIPSVLSLRPGCGSRCDLSAVPSLGPHEL